MLASGLRDRCLRSRSQLCKSCTSTTISTKASPVSTFIRSPSMKIFLVALSALALVLSATTHAADTTPLGVKNNRNLIFFSGFSICDDNVTRDVGLFTILFHVVTLQVFADIGECDAPDSPDSPDAPACGLLEAPCTLDSDCCSALTCEGGECDVAPPPCGLLEAPCTLDSDCCSALTCQGGECDVAPPPCLAFGATCTLDTDCCTGNCDSGSCGAPCTAGGPCSSDTDCCDPNQGCPIDQACAACSRLSATCTLDTDCCTGNCDSGSCAIPVIQECVGSFDICFTSDAVCCNSGESCSSGVIGGGEEGVFGIVCN